MVARHEAQFTLVDLLLAEQQDLTAVERFARRYKSDSTTTKEALYRDLLPTSKPKQGEQYAFTVDLDRCSGCKACVSACHSLNGLEENELWRGVGLLVGRRSPSEPKVQTLPYLQTVTYACHHCVEPACLEGCPVLAYEKDPLTGIVRHLDDQCIGCQYCVLKCPYDVPKYSKNKGIVRKCDMCSSRLAVGEAPACVQACPHEAIRIDIVNQEVVRATASISGTRMVPGAFESAYTLPTTSYKSSKQVPDSARPLNASTLKVEQPHWPLVWMLVLTQLAAGLHLLHAVFLSAGTTPLPRSLSNIAFAVLLGALTMSVFHLGRPLKAWRSFLGWRRSWMSREIIVFSFYATAAAALTVLPIAAPLAIATALLGILAVYCSAMIYIDTQRPGWSARFVFPRFYGTVFLLGATGGAALSASFLPLIAPVLGCIATIFCTALFTWDRVLSRHAVQNPASAFHRTALATMRFSHDVIGFRTLLFITSTLFSVMAILNTEHLAPLWADMSFLTTFTFCILERWLFFTATQAPRMPGGVLA